MSVIFWSVTPRFQNTNEPEVVKMGACVLCEQQITNPICPERLESQMKTWLLETKPELIEELEEESRVFSKCADSEDVCIITKRHMNVCVYCYTEHIFNWLKQTNADKETLSEFMQYFNFDLGWKGYYEEAQRLDLV